MRDLLAAVPTRDVRTVVDIGCGPGNSTELLVARFPGATVSAVDNSPDMLAAARRRLPKVRFDEVDIDHWQDPGPFDLILANAVLQWIPDHRHVFANLVAKLAEGGTLAVQMPDNLDEPAHRLMREVAGEGPWADKLANASRSREARHDATWYYEILRPSCASVDVWRTTYHHRLEGGASGVVEWFKGTGLRPFLDPLDATEREGYLARYTSAIAHAYAPLTDGSILLPFPRLFIVATR